MLRVVAPLGLIAAIVSVCAGCSQPPPPVVGGVTITAPFTLYNEGTAFKVLVPRDTSVGTECEATAYVTDVTIHWLEDDRFQLQEGGRIKLQAAAVTSVFSPERVNQASRYVQDRMCTELVYTLRADQPQDSRVPLGYLPYPLN